jgi:hypothetical protein
LIGRILRKFSVFPRLLRECIGVVAVGSLTNP